MSSESLPISPTRFAAALKDLPLSTLHLKAAELRNSIAHLDYSNEQMKPFAEGSADGCNGVADQDCVDAIRENEGVVERMVGRLELLKNEVEGRGALWGEWEKVDEEEDMQNADVVGNTEGGVNGEGREGEERANPWADGTITTGRILAGEVVMYEGVTGEVEEREERANPWADMMLWRERMFTGEVVTYGFGSAPTPTVNGTGVSTNTTASTNAPTNGEARTNGTTGGRLDDEALRRAMEERMREDAEEEGLHL